MGFLDPVRCLRQGGQPAPCSRLLAERTHSVPPIGMLPPVAVDWFSAATITFTTPGASVGFRHGLVVRPQTGQLDQRWATR
jgi:hypothetical protein